MHLKCRPALGYFLLATFASISLLGEGLHFLTHETGQHHHHHHRHGLGIITSVAHQVSHDHRDFYLASHTRASANCVGCRKTTAGSLLFVTNNDVESHSCKICEYLFQAVSQQIEVAAPIEWQSLFVAYPSLRPLNFSRTTLGPQAARGPPLAT